VGVVFVGLVELLEPKYLSEFRSFYVEGVLEDAGLEVFGRLHLELPENPLIAEKFVGLIFGNGKLKEYILNFIGRVCRDTIKQYLDDFHRFRVEVEKLGSLESGIKAFYALSSVRQYLPRGYVGYPPRVEIAVGGLEDQPLTILCTTNLYSLDPAIIIPLNREGLKFIPRIEETATKHSRRRC